MADVLLLTQPMLLTDTEIVRPPDLVSSVCVYLHHVLMLLSKNAKHHHLISMISKQNVGDWHQMLVSTLYPLPVTPTSVPAPVAIETPVTPDSGLTVTH